jgi:hypothetical protein
MVQGQRASRDRQSGEDDESHAVGRASGDEAAHHAFGLGQTVAGEILGLHRAGHVEGDDDIHAVGFHGLDLRSCLGPCQSHDDEQQRQTAHPGQGGFQPLPGAGADSQPLHCPREDQSRVAVQTTPGLQPGGGQHRRHEDQQPWSGEAEHQAAPASAGAGRGLVESTMR